MSFGLTEKQKKLLEFLTSEIGETGIAPSYEEICRAMNISSKGRVNYALKTLEERGYIRRIPAKARAIEIIDKPKATDDLRAALNSIANIANFGVKNPSEALQSCGEIAVRALIRTTEKK